MDKKNRGFIILLIAGVLLLLFSFIFTQPQSYAAKEDKTLDVYKAELEAELADFCSSVSGAGKCRVMVSFSSGEKFEYKGNTLIGVEPPVVCGITVLCKGGDSESVRAEISSLLSALYGIRQNRICVLKLSS